MIRQVMDTTQFTIARKLLSCGKGFFTMTILSITPDKQYTVLAFS